MPVVDIAEMVERTQDELAPAYLIMAAAAVSLLATLCFKETYRTPLGVSAARADKPVLKP
jgi:hypothetical protein